MKRKILALLLGLVAVMGLPLIVAPAASASTASFYYDYAYGSMPDPVVTNNVLNSRGSITTGYKPQYPVEWAEQQYRITQLWQDGTWHDVVGNITIRSYSGQTVNQLAAVGCPDQTTHTYHAAWRHEFVPVNNDGSGGLHYHQGNDVKLACGGFFK